MWVCGLQLQHCPVAHFSILRKKSSINFSSVSSQRVVFSWKQKLSKSFYPNTWRLQRGIVILICSLNWSPTLPRPSWLVRIFKVSWRVWQSLYPRADPIFHWNILANHSASHSWDSKSHIWPLGWLLKFPATSRSTKTRTPGIRPFEGPRLIDAQNLHRKLILAGWKITWIDWYLTCSWGGDNAIHDELLENVVVNVCLWTSQYTVSEPVHIWGLL